MKLRLISIVFCSFCVILSLAGQRAMSLSEVIAIGLENNHQVKMERNVWAMAKNNQTLGTGGFLPSITGNASYIENLNSTRQERFDGTVTEKEDAQSTNTGANLQANWVLFDGMRMFYDNERYRQLGRLGELHFRETMENTLAEIILGYYSVVQQQKGIDVAAEAFGFSVRRRELARARFRLGAASETDWLQASIDANADSVAWVSQQMLLSNAKAELCLLVGLDVETELVATDSIGASRPMLFADLLNDALRQNASLQAGEVAEQVTRLQAKMANSPKYPKLSMNASYAYSLSEAEVGIFKSNRNVGTSVGVALNYPLFDGFKVSTAAKNAQLNSQNAQLQLQYAYEKTKTDLLKRHNDYTNQLHLLDVARENVLLSRRNTLLAYERFRLGQISDLDFRQIQYIQTDTENRYLIAQWRCKQLEVELLRLSGRLVGVVEN
jgi:outer membrane protein